MNMNTQPTALLLADELEDMTCIWVPSVNRARVDKAAAELRRLHELNQELLKALNTLKEWCGLDDKSDTWINSGAQAATAKATP